jgi:hypothetical protein
VSARLTAIAATANVFFISKHPLSAPGCETGIGA